MRRRLATLLSVLAVFCVWGDTRPSSSGGSTPDAFRALVTRLAGVSYADNVTVGDYVYASSGDSAQALAAKYAAFTDASRPIGGRRTLYTPGNHELVGTSATLHDGYVAALGTHDPYVAYARAWRGAAIAYVHLPSEGQGHNGTVGYYGEDDARNSAEAVWLVATLRANRAAAVFVFMHHPVYDPKPSDPWSGSAEPARLDALFAKYGVDAVFAGHLHYYRRHRSPSGVTYVTQGMGGAPPYAATYAPLDAYDKASWGSPWAASYTEVTVYRKAAYCASWRMDAAGVWEQADTFTLWLL